MTRDKQEKLFWWLLQKFMWLLILAFIAFWSVFFISLIATNMWVGVLIWVLCTLAILIGCCAIYFDW